MPVLRLIQKEMMAGLLCRKGMSGLLKRFLGVLTALLLALIVPGIANALPGGFALNQPTTACKEDNPEIYLSWETSPNAAQYDVYRNDWVYAPKIQSMAYNNKDHVVSGKTYTFFIRASDSTGTTDSNPVTVTAPVCVASAESKIEAKLNERICTEYGYVRLSVEFNKCMQDPLANIPKHKISKNPEEIGVLHDAFGDVKVESDCLMERDIAKGALLEKSMVISTGEKSHAVLKFEDGQVIALQANSVFKIHDYRLDFQLIENNNVFFSMLKGGLRSITGLLGKIRPEAFKLQTPSAVVGIRGTDFMAVMNEKMYLHVTSGSVELDNAAGKMRLNAGETAVVASADAKAAAVSIKEIPPEIFTQLKAIPVPSTTPRNPSLPVRFYKLKPNGAKPIEAKPASAGAAAKRRTAEDLCKDYDYDKDPGEYETCLQYAEAEGFEREGKKDANVKGRK